MGAMAVTRRTEPWSDLLDAGRADERLVREAYEGARVSPHSTSSVGRLKHSDLPDAVPVVTIVGPSQAASSASA